MALKLVIGNKNYSSWSFRPWIAMKATGIAFEDTVISLDDPAFKATLLKLAGQEGAGADRRRVPCGSRLRSSNTWRRNFPRPACGRRSRRLAPMRARSPRRCMPASCRCAATYR